MEYELLKYEMNSFFTDTKSSNSQENCGVVDYSNIPVKIPSIVTEEDWEYLLTIQNKSQRLRYYRYLFKNEMSNKNLKQKKEKARLEKLATKRNINPSEGLQYGLNENTLFYYIRESAIKHYRNHYLAYNKWLKGPDLIIDFAFEKYMNSFEKNETANQMREMYALNRLNKCPFNFIITNCNGVLQSKVQYQELQNLKYHKKDISGTPLLHLFYNRLGDATTFIDNYEKSYLDLYPHKQLIYLSPNAERYMTEYDCNATYIIGALVEKGSSKPLSLAQAKKQNIKTLKLPLDLHIRWGCGNKDLPLNQVLGIMLDIKNTNDWKYSLRKHVPRRKLYESISHHQQADRRFNSITAGNV